MDPIQILLQLGLGVATNAVYDLLKRRIKSQSTVERSTLEKEIENVIALKGVKVDAGTVIEALAKNGFLVIEGSFLHGPKGLTFGSVNGSASLRDNSRLSTDLSAIEAGPGASMETQGNSQVQLNPDGSISFMVGENNGGAIIFYTSG